MTSSLTQSKAYWQAALSLRQSLRRNKYDAAFAQRDGTEIRYIFDTNVFVFHADLNDDYRLNRNFDFMIGQVDTTPVSRAIERITADFIFSGELPGQISGKGYISVPHLEETMMQAEKISRSLAVTKRSELPSVRAEAIGMRVAAVLNADASTEKKLEELVKIVPSVWVESLKPSVQFTTAMKTAFLTDPPGLIPLDWEEWGRTASRVSLEDVAFWTEVLPSHSRRRQRELIESDAETLATIVNLYRTDPQAHGPSRTRLYLFLTADEGVAQAVSRRAEVLREEGVPYFVRSPQDYSPLLNLGAIREALAPVGFSDEMRKEFKAVFAALTAALEWLGIARQDGVDLSEVFQKSGALRALQSSWTGVSRYVTLLHAYHFVQAARRIFGELGEFMATAEGATAAAERVKDTVIDVRTQHMAIVLNSAIAAIARDAGEKPQRHLRAQIKLVGNVFGPLLPPGTGIGGFLEEAVKRGELPPEVFAYLKWQPKKLESQLLTACLFVAAERWNSAAQFAARAAELTRRRKDRREIAEAAYLHALCLRFALHNRGDYRRARRHLQRNLKDYRNHPADAMVVLRRFRDEIELGTLDLTAAIMQAISAHRRKTGVDRQQLRLLDDETSAAALMTQAASAIRAARNDLLDSEPFEFARRGLSQREGQALIESLKSQAEANLLAVYIFERLVPGLQSAMVAVDDPTELLAEMAERTGALIAAGHSPRPTPWLYQCVGTILHTSNRDIATAAARDAVELLETIDLSGRGVPPMDVLEFGFLRSWLTEWLTSTGNAAADSKVPSEALVHE
jgi:hypothetical protein